MDQDPVTQKALDVLAVLEERAGKIADDADRFYKDVEAAAVDRLRRSMDVPPDAKP